MNFAEENALQEKIVCLICNTYGHNIINALEDIIDLNFSNARLYKDIIDAMINHWLAQGSEEQEMIEKTIELFKERQEAQLQEVCA